MKHPFLPDLMEDSVYDIDFDALIKKGIKLIIFDIDNTLAPYEIPTPDEKLCNLFSFLKEKGFIFAFASNNKGDRVELFNKSLGAFYVCNAKKPLTGAFKKIMAKYNIGPENAVGIGDQIFTDVCASNLCGMYSIMVLPINDKKTLFFRFKRWMEIPFVKMYKAGMNKSKGEVD